MVRLLDIAILVTAPWGVAIGLHPVMLQRYQIAVVERPGSIPQLVGRRRKVVRPMKLRRLAQLPDRRLEAADQGLEALRKADPARLPV